MKRGGITAAFVLLIVTNVIVLAGVKYNRTGEPDAEVALTEREAQLARFGDKNSVTYLILNWQRDDNPTQEWFNREKLAQVGFDCSMPPDAKDAELFYKRALPRTAYVVLEFEGQAWEAWNIRKRKVLEDLKSSAKGREGCKDLAREVEIKRLEWLPVEASHLFPVDVGKDPELLRRHYPDRHRYIISPAVIMIRLMPSLRVKGNPPQPATLTGDIKLLTGTVHVPHDYQGPLAKLTSGGKQWCSCDGPRFRVLLHYGKRHEPWIVAVLPYGKNQRGP